MSKTIRFQFDSNLGDSITGPIITKTKFKIGESLYNMSLRISGLNRAEFYNFLDEYFSIKVKWTQKESQKNVIVCDMPDDEFVLWCLRINRCEV